MNHDFISYTRALRRPVKFIFCYIVMLFSVHDSLFIYIAPGIFYIFLSTFVILFIRSNKLNNIRLICLPSGQFPPLIFRTLENYCQIPPKGKKTCENPSRLNQRNLSGRDVIKNCSYPTVGVRGLHPYDDFP